MKLRVHVLGFLSLCLGAGCVSTTTPESTSYEEWKQEQKARWEAKRAGVEYKTKAQVRREAEELRAIAAEVMNATIKPAKARSE